MIQISHNSVVDINGLVSSANLTDKQLAQLNEYEKVSFSVLDYSNIEFKNLLQDVLERLQESYKIYLVYVESKAQPKSRIRSYKKMFHSHKKTFAFKENEIKEKEIDITDNESILVASIRLTKSNREYVMKNLINSNFRFGYLVRKGKKSFSTNINYFLENVVSLLSKKSKISRIDFIELLLTQVKKNKNIFRIPISVNEKDYIEFLIRKEDKKINKELEIFEHKYNIINSN